MESGKFLQSKKWEDFQSKLGRKVFRIDNSLIIKLPLKLGLSYLYCPKSSINNLVKIKELAKKEKSIFFRCEPSNKEVLCKHIQKTFLSCVKTKNIQPACTQILNLTDNEDELLKKMKQKTRYNIRLAEKKGVVVKKETNIEGLQTFYNLLQATYNRQNIKTHPKIYYKRLANFNDIFIAYYKNKPLASAMINLNNDIATYLHGGSTQEERQVMAPYLLHWEIIKYYKKKGAKYYDWWGIDEKKWPGITRFKRGFGGEEICTTGTIDIPINKYYYTIYKILRR